MSKRQVPFGGPRRPSSPGAWPSRGASSRSSPARGRSGRPRWSQQVTADSACPVRYASADEPTLRGPEWIADAVGGGAARGGRGGRDPRARRGAEGRGLVRVGQAPVGRGHASASARSRSCCSARRRCSSSRGLTESLAGRFEVLRLPHWSLAEMREAFGFTLDQYLYFGGYPGAAPLVGRADRWRRYILDALVETTIARDVLLLTRVDKPALLRRLFELGCRYSGQVLSYTKMLGQLHDAGNTTTLAHYLELLGGRRAAHRAPQVLRPAPCASADRAPSSRCSTPRSMTAQSRAVARRGARRTASSGGAWSSRRSVPTSPTRPPRASASSSTGASATARWTSSSAPAAAVIAIEVKSGRRRDAPPGSPPSRRRSSRRARCSSAATGFRSRSSC